MGKQKRRLKKKYKIIFTIVGILIVCGIFAAIFYRPQQEIEPVNPNGGFSDVDINESEKKEEKNLNYIVFDSGNALSVLVDFEDFEVLIDGGTPEFGPALVEKLKPYVSNDGVIEYVIATHAHMDHVGGLQFVYDAFNVKKTIYGDLSDEGFFWYFQNAAEKDGGEFVEDTNMTIDLGNNASLTIYDITDGEENPNNNSVITYVTYGNNSFLCTGDLESELEKKLTAFDLHPTVLVAGHHGSNTSNSLLSVYRPAYFVVSAGANNDYYQPHKTVLEDAIRYCGEVFGTWKSGDMIFTTNGTKLEHNINYETRLTVEDAGAKTTNE